MAEFLRSFEQFKRPRSLVNMYTRLVISGEITES